MTRWPTSVPISGGRQVPRRNPTTSWMVATPAQTGVQINANPQWIASGDTLTFTAYNAFNRVLGGRPSYWSAQVTSQQTQPLVIPLTPAMSHIVAIGS